MAKELFKTTKQIFSAGVWNGITITREHLDKMVSNFNDLRASDPRFTQGVPLKIDLFKDTKPEGKRHGGMPACGWITKIERVDDKLNAFIESIPRTIKELIDNKAYTRVSSEVAMKFKQGEQVLNHVLTGVALLGVEYPGVHNLDEFAALYAEELDEVLNIVFQETQNTNPPEDKQMTEQEAKDLKAKADQAEADAKKFKAEAEAATAAKAESDAKVKKFNDDARKAEIKTFVEAQKKEGRILPAQEALVESFMGSMSDTVIVKFGETGKEVEKSQVEMFKDYVLSLPKIVNFKEESHAEGGAPEIFTAKPEEEAGSKESQELDFKAKKFMEAHKDVSYRDALIAVSKPEQK